MYREKGGGEGEIADSLPVFHIQLLYVALASGHIFSPVSELLAKTPFLQIGQLSNPPVTLTKIYINGRGRGERALLHYIILFSIFSICPIASHIEIPLSTVKLVNDYDTSIY